MTHLSVGMTKCGRSGRAAGFTLIELLIALTVLTLLVGVLFAGLRMGDRAWRAVEDKSNDLSEMRLVWGFIDNRIRDFQPVFHDFDGDRRILFSGTDKAMEFLSTSSYQNGFGGFYIIRLQLVPGDEGRRLALKQWLYQPDVLEGTEQSPEWTELRDDGVSPLQEMEGVSALYSEAVLLEKVTGFSIEYWGSTDNSEASDWHSEWLEKFKAPELIKIRIEREGLEWPELFFATLSNI